MRIERWITRPLASLVVRSVYNTKVTPNQLTAVSSILGILGGLSYFGGRHGYFILGGILVQLSSVFDCADGQLARSKGLQSRFGTYLDLFLDRIVDFFILIGLMFGCFLYSGKTWLLVAGLVSVALYFLQVNLYYIGRQYENAGKTGDRAEARGFTLFVIFAGSLFNRLDILILLIILETVINNVYRVIRFLSSR